MRVSSDSVNFLRFESFPSRVSIFLELQNRPDFALLVQVKRCCSSRDVSSPVPAHLQFLASGVKDTVVTPDMLKGRVKNKSA